MISTPYLQNDKTHDVFIIVNIIYHTFFSTGIVRAKCGIECCQHDLAAYM